MDFRSRLKLNIWTTLCLFGLFATQAIQDWIRPVYGAGEGWLPFLLGVLPNFIPAGFSSPFAGLMYRDYQLPIEKRRNPKNLTQWFWVSMLITQIGLNTWEFLQKTGNLRFDVNDLYANVAGAFVATLLFYALRGQYLKQLSV